MTIRAILITLVVLSVVGALALRLVPGLSDQIPADDTLKEGIRGQFVLAISWQSAFCEKHRRKKECRNGSNYHSGQFSLHGLWPQPRDNVYCGVNKNLIDRDRSAGWLSLPKLELTADTRTRLVNIMPGTQSGLHRHEWIKHGTCYSRDPETYFAHAINLVHQINASPLGRFFSRKRGLRVTAKEIRKKVVQSFGVGSANKISISCVQDNQRRLISELRLQLQGTISTEANIAKLLGEASAVNIGCRQGIIDPPGNQ